DKILTAGPSAWESAETNLVDELRILVRARDMALAEQRARHVKESVVIREQRHALETAGPASSTSIANLLGWADSADEQKSGSPHSVPPASVTPIFSRSNSPISSPTNARQKREGNWLDNAASGAQFGGGTTVIKGAADASVAGARHAESQQQSPSSSHGVVQEFDAKKVKDEADNMSGGVTREQSVPSRIVFPDAPSSPDANGDEARAGYPCPRCIRLGHERDVAVTERSLAEVELVSIRRVLSQIDPTWKCKTEVISRSSVAPGDAASENEKVNETTPMLGEGGSRNDDIRLREEAIRLEKLAPLSEDGPSPPDLDEKSVDMERLPIAQEFALVSGQDDAKNSANMPNLAASMSAAVTSRARHFEELSRRRLLRLGVEADLRAARVKLDSLLGSAVTAPSSTTDHPKGDEPGEIRDKKGEPCRGQGAPSPSSERGVGDPPAAHGRSNDTTDSTDSDVGASSPNCVSSTRGNGSRVKGEAGPGRGQSASAQRRGGGGAGKNRRNVVVPQAAEDPSRASRETVTMREAPKMRAEEKNRSSRGNAEVATSRTTGTNSTADGSSVEGKNAVVIEAEDKAKGAVGVVERVEQAEHEDGDNRGQPLHDDDIQASKEHGKGAGEEEPPTRSAAERESVEAVGTVLESEVFFEAGGTTGEAVGGTMGNALHAEVSEDTKHAGDKDTPLKKDALRKGQPKQIRARVAQGYSRGKAGRGSLARTRPTGKAVKTTSVSRAVGGAPTRLGTTMKARRLTQDEAARSLPARASPDADVTANEPENAQETKAAREDRKLIAEDVGEPASRVQATGKAARAGDPVEEGRGDYMTNQGVEMTAATGNIDPDCASNAHHTLAAASEEELVVIDIGDGLHEDGKETRDRGDGLIAVTEQPIPEPADGSDDLALPGIPVRLVEALRIEVDKLRLEKAELEDTVAQLNVAAAQLYIAEYQQMKAKCRQLKRVVLGPASRPTEVESSYGHSCQEIMHRLKTIGVKFFRRRIGGAMGAQFFPDGLSRMLTLIGRERVAQGCQTAPSERYGSTDEHADLPALPGSRDVHVQVAGGIDAEDEPLMEQQVYALLGRLDLLLKRCEDVLFTYHREAAEGAREARALLALAAAQHHPGQAWGVSRPPDSRPLIGGREGPAGAPRPAINPTNLLFSAAVVLDSVAAANAANQSPDDVPTREEKGPAARKGESRRQRFSAAEKALLELADEVVAALEAEQRRSDASAERRRTAANSHSNSSRGDASPALGRPPMGVPPLIWAMEIHLVGKLARAFRTAVEARGFEREVEDANLVAAVTLGRSSPPTAGKSGNTSPWHLGHRMLSVLRGEGEEGGGVEEDGARLQTIQREFPHGSKERTATSRRENPQFEWGSETFSPRITQQGSVSCNDATHGHQTFRSSPATSPRKASPRKAEGLARGEQYRRQAVKGRPGIRDGHPGPTPNRCGGSTSVKASEVRSMRQNNGSRTVERAGRKAQDQQRREQQRRDSAAVARVEAAVFDTVRPSRLHPRPGSASVAGRSDRAGYGGCGAFATAERLRPQSARLAEPRHTFPGGGGEAAIDGQHRYDGGSSLHVQRDGRRTYEGNSASESCTTAPRREQPVRPTPTGAAGRRPASAGGRVVDTRIWSSNNRVVEARAGVFRCRPNKAIREASVRFESATAGGGVSGSPSSPHVPTHSGEVPDFLRHKELELIKANKEKQAAANGRFAIVPSDGDQVGRGSGEGSADDARAVHGPDELWRHPSNGQRRPASASESRDGREAGVGVTLVEKSYVGSGSDDDDGGRTLTSLRLEDSMDGEGLLPDAGEQAFFDAWKPTGYGIDLSRYD
ncbi:unnamed protein product, partial [Scytosiphon promiscuus]